MWKLTERSPHSHTQAAFEALVRKARGATKALVVAGCVPQAERRLASLEGVSVVGTQQIDRVVEVVEATLAGGAVRLLSRARLPALDLPKVRRKGGHVASFESSS